MSRSDKLYGTAALSLIIGVHVLVGAMDTAAQAPDKMALSALKSDRPAVECRIERATQYEVPDENERITAALIEQGYFR